MPTPAPRPTPGPPLVKTAAPVAAAPSTRSTIPTLAVGAPSGAVPVGGPGLDPGPDRPGDGRRGQREPDPDGAHVP